MYNLKMVEVPLQLISEHAHHWIIEPPNGPKSAGTCKKCNLTRDFNNGGDDNAVRSDRFLSTSGRSSLPRNPIALSDELPLDNYD